MNDELASSLVRRALVADVVCVILFATIGRACHGEALSPGVCFEPERPLCWVLPSVGSSS